MITTEADIMKIKEEVEDGYVIECSNAASTTDADRKFQIKIEPELEIMDNFDVCELQSEDIFTIEFIQEEESNSKSQRDFQTNRSDIFKNHNVVMDANEKSARQSTNPEEFFCVECAYKTNSKPNLKRHTLARHTMEVSYSCYVCNFKTDCIRALTTHRESHGNPKIYSCSNCNFECVHLTMMRAHERDHLLEKTSQRLFFCAHCDYRSFFKLNLKQHMKTHQMHSNEKARETIYLCSLCNYETKRRRCLNWHHKRIHLGEEPFRCHICKMAYSTSGSLNRHLKIHSKKQYSIKCSECDYETLQHSSLNAHMKNHSREPYKCSQCNFETHRKSSLKSHGKCHLENVAESVGKKVGKPSIKSLSCNSSFEEKKCVREQRGHLSCSQCNYRTPSMTEFASHVPLHLEKNALTCTQCGYKTMRKQNYNRHFNAK